MTSSPPSMSLATSVRRVGNGRRFLVAALVALVLISEAGGAQVAANGGRRVESVPCDDDRQAESKREADGDDHQDAYTVTRLGILRRQEVKCVESP